MELRESLRRRRMRRAFTGEPISLDVLEELCVESLRAPTAGHSRGVTMVVTDRVDDFLLAATDAQWRSTSRRYPDLALAGAVVIISCQPTTYVERYRDNDKTDERLRTIETWPVPYWIGDAGMATMALLLLIEEARVQATFWGAFRHDDEVKEFAGIARDDVIYGYVLVGHGTNDLPSTSVSRPGPTRAERVRRLAR